MARSEDGVLGRIRRWFRGPDREPEPEREWVPEPGSWQTPGKCDGYDFNVRVRYAWSDGGRSLERIKERAADRRPAVSEQVEVAVRCELRRFAPHQAAEAEHAINRKLEQLAGPGLAGTTLRWTARVEVSPHADIRDLYQKSWIRRLQQEADHEHAKRIARNFDDLVRTWWIVLRDLGISDLLEEDGTHLAPQEVPPPFLVPFLARLAMQPERAADVVDDMAAKREGKDDQLMRTVLHAIANVESIDVNLLEYEDGQNSALTRLMQWAGLRVPTSAAPAGLPGGAE